MEGETEDVHTRKNRDISSIYTSLFLGKGEILRPMPSSLLKESFQDMSSMVCRGAMGSGEECCSLARLPAITARLSFG